MTRTGAIVQARLGSTRLPGKALLDLAGEPMLVRVMDRLKRTPGLDEVMVATTDKPADDAIEKLCRERGWPCFRGSEDDVLARYHGAATTLGLERVVRITSDCPLIDPEIVGRVVAALGDGSSVDYASNSLPPRTFPRGLDAEAFTFAALDRAHAEDHDPRLREHVTPFIYRHPELFRLAKVESPVDLSHHRWTVDTPEDLALARAVFVYFGHDRFTLSELLVAFELHPDWSALNAHVEQKAVAG